MGALLVVGALEFALNCLTDSSVSKQLVDKMYEKRKAAALELEKYVHWSLSRSAVSSNIELSCIGRSGSVTNKATTGGYPRLWTN